MFRATIVVSLVGLLACDGSTASVRPQTDASADATGDARLPDDGLADVAAACPPQQPSGPCSGSPSCTYGCTSCQCAGGFWFCIEPQCLAACAGAPGVDVAETPKEGTPCVSTGGCCSHVTVGDTCTFTLDGGTVSATCEWAQDASESAWHLSSPSPGTLDGGGDAVPE
jgi:hypothetical protein